MLYGDNVSKKAKTFIDAFSKDYSSWNFKRNDFSRVSSLKDVGSIPDNTWHLLIALDYELVGTPEYMGIASFWSHDYKHYLRECTPPQRRKIHRLALENGVDCCVDNDLEVWKIIVKVLKLPCTPESFVD